jgi:hypothetical protein
LSEISVIFVAQISQSQKYSTRRTGFFIPTSDPKPDWFNSVGCTSTRNNFPKRRYRNTAEQPGLAHLETMKHPNKQETCATQVYSFALVAFYLGVRLKAKIPMAVSG